MTESPAVTWLTQEAHDRLAAELDELKTTGRRDIAEKIDQARSEGDLKENGGYHAAREEQGKIEARIAHLDNLLRTAVVGEAPPDDGVVEPGMVVTATVAGDRMTFLLGSREVAEGTDLDVYSERSPLGEAINGRTVGDTVTYTAPSGSQIEVEIHEATPFSS